MSTDGGEGMNNIVQGVRSQIDFPLGQDEIAVGRAINSLLDEGWEFGCLTKTSLSLFRKWEITEEEMQGGLEAEKQPNPK